MSFLLLQNINRGIFDKETLSDGTTIAIKALNDSLLANLISLWWRAAGVSMRS